MERSGNPEYSPDEINLDERDVSVNIGVKAKFIRSV